MDKAILKKFAIESRELLMNTIANNIKSYKVDEDFEKYQNGDLILLKNSKTSLKPLGIEQYNKREKLVSRIRSLSDSGDFETGKKRVIEESAYTWFNRIIAIRYMEINDMLPLTKDNRSLGIRVLSSRDNTPHPEILKINNLTNKALDLDIKIDEYTKLTSENEQFKYVLKKVCNKLGKIIPQIFDGNTDYIDILLPENLLSNNGFVTKVISEIPEDNFKEVEIIGWLYQYYNQTEKDRAISKKGQYDKDEIPYVTQLFTPDWIVKYMVENTLGRFWIEHNGDERLIDNWKYFIKDNIKKQNEEINPEEIKFIDPCCGSGHILMYAFEVLYQIYLSKKKYIRDNIPELILKNNLYGLDIDDRAGQLSVLSVLLKARQYDENIFNKNVIQNLNVLSIQETNNIDKNVLNIIKTDNETGEIVDYVYDIFKNAKEIGSLLKIENKKYDRVIEEIEVLNKKQVKIFDFEKIKIINEKIMIILKIAKILTNKYEIVVTNPPYMNNGTMSNIIRNYLNKYYNDSKIDLCTAFMEFNNITEKGYFAMINEHAWMFLQSSELLRKKILNQYQISSMVHLGIGTFGNDFGTTSFVLKKDEKAENKSVFIRLVNFKNLNSKEEKYLEFNNNKNPKYYYNINSLRFDSIPGSIFAYWIKESLVNLLKEKNLGKKLISGGRFKTCNDEKYLRFWWEIDNNSHRWHNYCKGGDGRKFVGNEVRVVDWDEKAQNYYKNNGGISNSKYWGQDGITWSTISSSVISFRIKPSSYFNSSSAPTIFPVDNCNVEDIISYLNSKPVAYLLNVFNPTASLTVNDVLKLPYLDEWETKDEKRETQLVFDYCRNDWNRKQLSYNYTKSPILEVETDKIEDAVTSTQNKIKIQYDYVKDFIFKQNKKYERIFEIEDEIDMEPNEKDITIEKLDRKSLVQDFISFSVGCMFGRYSLDEDGLIYAGGVFDKSRYKSYEVDLDNVIPITEEKFFKDDIAERFKHFVEVVYGKEKLNENLIYIADSLGRKNNEDAEETIRRYFINDFYKDHIKEYQKKPIYWMFDSGKKNGFKCLIYMHRYNENLVAKIRLDYLYKLQKMYESRLNEIKTELNTGSLSIYDVKKIEKEQENIQVKLDEIKSYNDKLSTIGDKKIKIDLDDGVTENYKKFIYVDPITNKESSILGEEKTIIPKKK